MNFFGTAEIAVRQLGMPVEAALAPLVEQEKIGARKIAVIRHDEHGAVRQCRRLVQAERIVRKIGAGLALPEALTMAGAAAMHRKSGKIEAGQTLRSERFLHTVGNGSAVPSARLLKEITHVFIH